MVRQSAYSRLAVLFLVTGILLTLIYADRKVRASTGVDVAILIALDVSASVDVGEFELMREGLAAAISSPQVIKAVTNGRLGAIAVNVIQWSGFNEQEVKIDWTRLSTEIELLGFAARIRNMTRRYENGATDIGGAIDYSRDLVLASPHQATRSVIDIAGDGPNNVNYSPSIARDKAVKAGITINGLAVVGEVPILVSYYSEFVIGGVDAFVEKAGDYDGFERAMRRKLVREIGSMFLF